MTEIQAKIVEIEGDLKKLIRKADTLNPGKFGYIQQKAIISFVNGCRGLQGWELGELKTAFGMGVMKY